MEHGYENAIYDEFELLFRRPCIRYICPVCRLNRRYTVDNGRSLSIPAYTETSLVSTCLLLNQFQIPLYFT